MSTVAIITDIHGNLPALEAALAVVDEIAPDGLSCGGDLG
jgi:Icc-related predicted phosphoesterase